MMLSIEDMVKIARASKSDPDYLETALKASGGASAGALGVAGLGIGAQLPIIAAIANTGNRTKNIELGRKLLEDFPELKVLSKEHGILGRFPFSKKEIAVPAHINIVPRNTGYAADPYRKGMTGFKNRLNQAGRHFLDFIKFHSAPPAISGDVMRPTVLAHEIGHHMDSKAGTFNIKKYVEATRKNPLKSPFGQLQIVKAELAANKNALKLLKDKLGWGAALKAAPILAGQQIGRTIGHLPIPTVGAGALLGAYLMASGSSD